jgi:hypothetical protein
MELSMTSWMRRITVLASGLIVLVALSGPADAGNFDGSKPFLCAVTSLMECDAGKCERETAESTGAPPFFRIDVPGKVITAEPARKSPLRSHMRADGLLIVQGGEEGRGWSATIDEETGKMSAGVVGQDHVFAVFGACTIP